MNCFDKIKESFGINVDTLRCSRQHNLNNFMNVHEINNTERLNIP